MATNSYSAVLVNSNKATVRELQSTSSQGFSGVKSPFFNANFSMQLPTGVVLRSFASSPKVAAVPTNNSAGLLTWNVNRNVKSGGKLKIALKMAAGACTTPAQLDLLGSFTYMNEFGPQTAQACLKRPLYVWAKSCNPIPKAGPTPKQTNKQVGLGPKDSWNSCACNVCKVRNR